MHRKSTSQSSKVHKNAKQKTIDEVQIFVICQPLKERVVIARERMFKENCELRRGQRLSCVLALVGASRTQLECEEYKTGVDPG